MKKILLFILLVAFTIELFSQSTNKDIIINKTAPMLQLNGTGAVIDFYNNDLRFTQSSDLLTLTGGNLKLPGISYGYSTIVTAAGVTTLTALSNYYQFFTGSATQSVSLPVTSTLTTGHTYFIFNNSSLSVTINSSGGNVLIIMAGGTRARITCILTSGTTAASWDVLYSGHSISSGKKITITNTLTFSGTDATTMTFPGTSATIARTDAGNSFIGTNSIITGSFGIETSSPLHKLSVVSTRALNLNAMNFVESDINKNRTTVAQARDTSSFNLFYSYTGSPTLSMTSKTGTNIVKIDSAKMDLNIPIKIYYGDTTFLDPGSIVYKTSDSTFYGCRYKTATGRHNWWSLDH
jgi:hypothetical protein